MSKDTKKKNKRDPFDYYPTPDWAVMRFLEKAHRRFKPGTWIEPSAGHGAIIRVVNEFYENKDFDIDWKCVELQKKFRPHLLKVSNDVQIKDYKDYKHTGKSAAVCITNPPYKEAEAIIKHARAHSDVVVMLLRVNFLASERRQVWLSKDTPDVYVLPNRPSFRWKGTDATEYGFFVWDSSNAGKIQILDSTPGKVRSDEKKETKKFLIENNLIEAPKNE